MTRRLRPAAVIGVDVDESLSDTAAARLRSSGVDGKLLHTDVRELPLPDQSLDVVIDLGTCYHIPDAGSAIQEVARVLRPGGLFVHETRVSQLLPIRSDRSQLGLQTALCGEINRLAAFRTGNESPVGNG